MHKHWVWHCPWKYTHSHPRPGTSLVSTVCTNNKYVATRSTHENTRKLQGKSLVNAIKCTHSCYHDINHDPIRNYNTLHPHYRHLDRHPIASLPDLLHLQYLVTCISFISMISIHLIHKLKMNKICRRIWHLVPHTHSNYCHS